MKNIFLLISLLSLFACKESNNETENSLNNNFAIETKIKTSQTEIQNKSCEEIINKIVKSSNLDIRNQKTFFTQIDRIEKNNLTIHVYFENNLSDDPNKKQIVESTIAWLELNPNESTLFNTTADPDNPIALNFDKKILLNSNIFDNCQISRIAKTKSIEKDLNYAVLPIDFDEYYDKCVYPYDSIVCNKKYPKYLYKENDNFAKIIGKDFRPSDYMYLQKINNLQPIILCNTDSDTSSYDLIIVENNKIISSLEIGVMNGQSITQFNISKDYIITLFKRKNTNEKNKKWKAYKITQKGIISELN